MIIRPKIYDSRPEVSAAFSTRRGGVSEGPYATLNLGLSTGDNNERVLENRRRLCNRIGADPDQLVVAGQIHGSDVKHVTEPGLFTGYDGMVTTEPNMFLAIAVADCAAVLIADLETGVIGACHAGWRGIVANVVWHTADAMKELGASAERLQAYVSPCISVDHFEVGPEVAEQFEDDVVIRQPGWEKPHVDLKAALVKQLRHVGLAPDRFEISPHCTYAEPDRFYSYRAQDGTTGRMMGVIGLTAG